MRACCQQAALLSRLTMIPLQARGRSGTKSPSGRARCSRQHRRRGGEIRRKGASLAGVRPQSLPDSESRRRIPASCPFPRNLCRQLRATRIPLAASDRRSEASFTPPSSPVQLGEKIEILATVPAGLADSRGPTWAWLPGQQVGSGLRQGSRGRLWCGVREAMKPRGQRLSATSCPAQTGLPGLSVAPCRMTDTHVGPLTKTTG